MTQRNPSTAVAVRDPADFSSVPASQQSRAVFVPTTLAEAMQLAEYMAGGIGVRQWMRGNPSACLALIQISMRWGMDPYIVANKAYYTNDTLAFESQLVNAVLNTSGQLIGRLKVEFSGDASGQPGRETLICRVSGRLQADPDQVFVHEQALARVKIRNSPLWTVNPRQQLQYHATRAWARLYMPEVLLGIYTPDEVADGEAMRIEQQTTPRGDTPAPDRRAYESAETAVVDADFVEIEAVDLKKGQNEPEKVKNSGKSKENTDDSTKKAADRADFTPAETYEPPKIPSNPEEWAAWRAEALTSIEAVKDMDGFNLLRAALQPVMDKADEATLGEVQGALADAVMLIAE